MKVRFKSTASLMLGEGGERGARRAEREASIEKPAASPAQPDPVKEGIKALRGIFGR